MPMLASEPRLGQTERCGVLGLPHTAEVHRFDMHAPERLKRQRTAVRTHAVAIGPRPLGLVRLPVLRLPFRLFPARFLQIFRTLAQILRAHQMARPAHQTCRRNIVFLAVVPASRALPYQAATWFDQNGLSAFAHERRGAIGDSPQQQRSRNGARTKYQKDVQDSDAYRYEPQKASHRRQDKAGFPASGTSFLSVCLHIVLGRSPTFDRAQRAALFPIVVLFQCSESRRS